MSSWVELTIVGPPSALAALLADRQAHVLTDADLDLADESLGERLLEAVHLDRRHRVYLPQADARELLAGVAAHPALRLEGARRELRGGFGFRADTPSREAAAKIRATLEAKLPPGIDAEGITQQEEVDSSARGVSFHDAVHEYTYRAEGRVEGDLPGLFEMHRRLAELDFVDAGRIELEGEEVAPSAL